MHNRQITSNVLNAFVSLFWIIFDGWNILISLAWLLLDHESFDPFVDWSTSAAIDQLKITEID